MNISFDLHVSPEDTKKITEVFNCTLAELDGRFSKFAKAAADEYLQMFLGRNAFRRANDFLDYRIYLLVIHVLDGKLPDEALVSRLFQTSATESRARIRSVTSKYQRGLELQIKGSVKFILDEAQYNSDDDTWNIEVNNQAVVDLLNAALAERNGRLQQVSKTRGTVASFSVSPASLDELKKHYA